VAAASATAENRFPIFAARWQLTISYVSAAAMEACAGANATKWAHTVNEPHWGEYATVADGDHLFSTIQSESA
jgi:hypothetical protein